MARSIEGKLGFNNTMEAIKLLNDPLRQQLYIESVYHEVCRSLMEGGTQAEVDFKNGVLEALKLWEFNGYTDKEE